jgi:hypothetical protein
LIVFIPGFTEHRAITVGLFFAAAFVAMWPCVFGSAPYSFWTFACVYWLVGFLLMVLLKAALPDLA